MARKLTKQQQWDKYCLEIKDIVFLDYCCAPKHSDIDTWMRDYGYRGYFNGEPIARTHYRSYIQNSDIPERTKEMLLKGIKEGN